jgi:hypothetical protein
VLPMTELAGLLATAWPLLAALAAARGWWP